MNLRCRLRTHYNYFRDGYDAATGRYTQSDPMLQPNRLITSELAFYVPLILQMPQWLQPYSYVTAKPLSEIDPYGLGPWGIIKCMWYGRKMEKYADQCQGECPNDMMGQLNFMRKYQAGFLEDAMLKCTCSKAEAAGDKDLCAKFFATWLDPDQVMASSARRDLLSKGTVTEEVAPLLRLRIR